MRWSLLVVAAAAAPWPTYDDVSTLPKAADVTVGMFLRIAGEDFYLVHPDENDDELYLVTVSEFFAPKPVGFNWIERLRQDEALDKSFVEALESSLPANAEALRMASETSTGVASDASTSVTTVASTTSTTSTSTSTTLVEHFATPLPVPPGVTVVALIQFQLQDFFLVRLGGAEVHVITPQDYITRVSHGKALVEPELLSKLKPRPDTIPQVKGVGEAGMVYMRGEPYFVVFAEHKMRDVLPKSLDPKDFYAPLPRSQSAKNTDGHSWLATRAQARRDGNFYTYVPRVLGVLHSSRIHIKVNLQFAERAELVHSDDYRHDPMYVQLLVEAPVGWGP